jgi:hypothetical protein
VPVDTVAVVSAEVGVCDGALQHVKGGDQDWPNPAQRYGVLLCFQMCRLDFATTAA